MPEIQAMFGMGTILLLAIVGSLMGIWIASMIGISAPNSQLKRFEKTLEEGHVLLMVDVPVARVSEITELVGRHTEVEVAGTEPAMPAFP
jgi:hypothetical protein